MNIIVCGFHLPSHFPIIENVLNFIKPEYCQISYDTEKLSVPKKTQVSFLKDDFINTYANYPVNWSEILPIDEDLIYKMSLCESIVLRMMDRLYCIQGFDTYEVRKMTYLRHLQYWNYNLLENKIKLVIFDIIPHQIYDYIIYELCRLYNIPYIILMQTGVDDFTFFVDNLNEFNSKLKNVFHDLNLQMEKKDELDIKLQIRSESHLNFQLSKNPMPFYTKNYLTENSFLNRMKRKIKIVLHSNPYKVLKIKISAQTRVRTIKLHKNIYTKLAKEPDLSLKYIYVPLHIQPECSTSPMAGSFVDQILIIKMLRYFLPKDVYIYVKEHVSFSLTGRSAEFYQEIASYPNVSLIQQQFNSFELIKNSLAVATATGTSGWEALFRGIPVLMFGSFFFEYAKGVYKIKTHEDMKNAVDHIFNKKEKPTIKDIKIYLNAMEETSIVGYIGEYYKSISHITPEENIKNISTAIIEKVKSFKIIN